MKHGLIKMKTIKQGNYTYQLDEHDRVVHAEGFLTNIAATRNQYNQQKSGGEDRLEDDHGGHLFGARFGGSSDPYNLVPMNNKVNIRDFKALEQEWQNELNDGNSVFANFDIAYESEDSMRPSAVMVGHDVNGMTRDYNSFGNINQMLYDDLPEYNESEAIDYAILNKKNNDELSNNSFDENEYEKNSSENDLGHSTFNNLNVTENNDESNREENGNELNSQFSNQSEFNDLSDDQNNENNSNLSKEADNQNLKDNNEVEDSSNNSIEVPKEEGYEQSL